MATIGRGGGRGRGGFVGSPAQKNAKNFHCNFFAEASGKNTKKVGFSKTTQKDQIQNLEAQVVYLRALETKSNNAKNYFGEQTVVLDGLFQPKFLRVFRKKFYYSRTSLATRKDQVIRPDR